MTNTQLRAGHVSQNNIKIKSTFEEKNLLAPCVYECDKKMLGYKKAYPLKKFHHGILKRRLSDSNDF